MEIIRILLLCVMALLPHSLTQGSDPQCIKYDGPTCTKHAAAAVGQFFSWPLTITLVSEQKLILVDKNNTSIGWCDEKACANTELFQRKSLTKIQGKELQFVIQNVEENDAGIYTFSLQKTNECKPILNIELEVISGKTTTEHRHGTTSISSVTYRSEESSIKLPITEVSTEIHSLGTRSPPIQRKSTAIVVSTLGFIVSGVVCSVFCVGVYLKKFGLPCRRHVDSVSLRTNGPLESQNILSISSTSISTSEHGYDSQIFLSGEFAHSPCESRRAPTESTLARENLAESARVEIQRKPSRKGERLRHAYHDCKKGRRTQNGGLYRFVRKPNHFSDRVYRPLDSFDDEDETGMGLNHAWCDREHNLHGSQTITEMRNECNSQAYDLLGSVVANPSSSYEDACSARDETYINGQDYQNTLLQTNVKRNSHVPYFSVEVRQDKDEEDDVGVSAILKSSEHHIDLTKKLPSSPYIRHPCPPQYRSSTLSSSSPCHATMGDSMTKLLLSRDDLDHADDESSQDGIHHGSNPSFIVAPVAAVKVMENNYLLSDPTDPETTYMEPDAHSLRNRDLLRNPPSPVSSHSSSGYDNVRVNVGKSRLSGPYDKLKRPGSGLDFF